MNASTYAHSVTISFLLHNQVTEINPNHIKYIIIESNYEQIFMPVIYISMSINRDTYSKIVNNEKEGKIYLKIDKYNEYSQNKLYKKYLEGQFTYLTSNNNPNYAEDLSSSGSGSDIYVTINLALMSMDILNKEKRSFNGIYKDIDQGTLILKAFEDLETVISPLKFNPHYKNIMIPPLSSIHKYLYYLYDMCPFYDTNYMFFMDFNRTYLLDYSGDYCPSRDGQKHTVILDINSVLSEKAYYEGMEETDEEYHIYINPSYSTIGLNKHSDKIINQLVFIDDEGDIQKVDINVNASPDSAVKQSFIRGEHAKLYMNVMNSSAEGVEVMKEGMDSSILTPNKMYMVNNTKDHSCDGKYCLINKREVIRNMSGTFRNSISLGLRKVGVVLPLRDDVEARAVYDNASAVYRQKNTITENTTREILTNNGTKITING